MRHYLENLWISIVYFIEDSVLRARYFVEECPLLVRGLSALAVGTLLVGALFGVTYVLRGTPAVRPASSVSAPTNSLSQASIVETKKVDTDERMAVQSGCDSNYTPCVPHSSTDLNCDDIDFSVRVIGNDRHGFDKDGDTYGCEDN